VRLPILPASTAPDDANKPLVNVALRITPGLPAPIRVLSEESKAEEVVVVEFRREAKVVLTLVSAVPVETKMARPLTLLPLRVTKPTLELAIPATETETALETAVDAAVTAMNIANSFVFMFLFMCGLFYINIIGQRRFEVRCPQRQ
jgi:hypothetical protein